MSFTSIVASAFFFSNALARRTNFVLVFAFTSLPSAACFCAVSTVYRYWLYWSRALRSRIVAFFSAIVACASSLSRRASSLSRVSSSFCIFDSSFSLTRVYYYSMKALYYSDKSCEFFYTSSRLRATSFLYWVSYFLNPEVLTSSNEPCNFYGVPGFGPF